MCCLRLYRRSLVECKLFVCVHESGCIKQFYVEYQYEGRRRGSVVAITVITLEGVHSHWVCYVMITLECNQKLITAFECPSSLVTTNLLCCQNNGT